jgi:hypothetical protein
VPLEAETVGATKAEFTITDTAVELTATPVLSITWRMKLQVPVAVKVEVSKL